MKLTTTQETALRLLDVEFKPGEKVFATWVDGVTISTATMKALEKKGYLKLDSTE